MTNMLIADGVAAATVPANAGQPTTREQLVGSWRVLNLKTTTGDKVNYPLGDEVAGFVTITSDRIWLMFVDATRKCPVSPALTDAEAIAMMRSQVAWTGQYATSDQTPDGIKVTARVDAASSQAITGTERVYLMRVDGNKLMVKSPGVIVPMTGETSVVEFEMVKAQ
jgi:hypothetical protein